MEHLDRFKMNKKLQEKSTQYYWYNGKWNEDPEDTEDSVSEADVKQDSGPEEIKTELSTDDLVPGTLVIIQGYGSNNEPRKYMWNKSRGEILFKNPDGSYKVRITDVKDSNVLYSKKWYDKEQKALTQRLNLKTDEFKTLKELENEEEKAAAEKEKAAAEKEKAEIEKARGDEAKAKEKEASDKKKAEEKAKKEAEKAEADKQKSENVKRISRRLI